jgi:hypothetical protein
VENLVEGHLGKPDKIGIGSLNVSEVKVHLTADGAVGIGVQEARGGPGHVALLGLKFGRGIEDNIGIEVIGELRDGHFGALLAFELLPRVIVVVDSETGFVEEFGRRDHLVH